MINEINSSRLDKDPELKPLLDKGVSLNACLCFAHWIRGYEPSEIGLFFKLSIDEVESNIALVKPLLSDDVLASQIQIRNDIKSIQARMKAGELETLGGPSLPTEELLDQGRNPVDILQIIREVVNTNMRSQVIELRKENRRSAITDSEDDPAIRDNARIAELRSKDTPAVIPIMTGKQCERGSSTQNFPEANKSSTMVLKTASRNKNRGRRVTFRLDDDLYEKMQTRCQETGCDFSALIRNAIVQQMEGTAASKGSKNVEMLPEAFARTAKYQVAGSDLKERLRENFLEFIAMAFVTSRRWHRTTWVKQLYQALLPLQQYLEADRVRQD